MRRSIGAEREHRLRRLRRHDHEFDGSLQHAGLRLERVEIVTNPLDVGRPVRFRNHDGIDARPHDSDKIVDRKAGIERVDPHKKSPVALVAPVDELCDFVASEAFLPGRDRILEIEDQRVGPAVLARANLRSESPGTNRRDRSFIPASELPLTPKPAPLVSKCAPGPRSKTWTLLT